MHVFSSSRQLVLFICAVKAAAQCGNRGIHGVDMWKLSQNTWYPWQPSKRIKRININYFYLMDTTVSTQNAMVSTTFCYGLHSFHSRSHGSQKPPTQNWPASRPGPCVTDLSTQKNPSIVFSQSRQALLTVSHGAIGLPTFLKD